MVPTIGLTAVPPSPPCCLCCPSSQPLLPRRRRCRRPLAPPPPSHWPVVALVDGALAAAERQCPQGLVAPDTLAASLERGMLCHDHRRRRRAPVQPACDFAGAAGVCAVHACMYLIVGRPPGLAACAGISVELYAPLKHAAMYERCGAIACSVLISGPAGRFAGIVII